MINKQILVGRAAKDPEIKEFTSGNKIVNLLLVTSELVGVKLHVLNELLEVLQLVIIYLQEAFEILCCCLAVFLACLAHVFT